MDSLQVLEVWKENICNGTAEQIRDLYDPSAVIFTEEAEDEIQGEVDILRYLDWYINKDPCLEFTTLEAINLNDSSIVNGLFTMNNMEGVFYKRCTFVIAKGKIITEHTSFAPQKERVGEG